MWKRLRPVWLRFWQRTHRAADERRTVAARGHFWAEVRAGEREAEAACATRPLRPEARR